MCAALLYYFHLIACAYFAILVAMQQLGSKHGALVDRLRRTTLLLLPTGMLILWYLASGAAAGPQIGTVPFIERIPVMIADLLFFTSVYFSLLQTASGALLLIVLYLLIRNPSNQHLNEAGRVFGGFCIVLVVIYLCAPPSFGGGAFFHQRITQMLLLGLIPVVAARQAGSPRIRLLLLPIAVAVIGFTINAHLYRENADRVQQFMALQQMPLKERSVIMSYKPHDVEQFRVDVLLHAVSYYALRHELLNAGNYEIQFDYFPVKLAPMAKDTLPSPDQVNYSPNEIDYKKYSVIRYVLSWTTDSPEQLAQYFTPIASHDKLALWERINE